MPFYKCSECHHEWEGTNAARICSWCDQETEGYIIADKSDLESFLESPTHREVVNNIIETLKVKERK